MLWLIGIASVWALVCAATLSLCVMARRGDDALAAAPRRVVDEDVPFVATLAAPEPVVAPPVAVPRPARTPVR